jgi:unsaturated rhamnogalacturonyl hydrolase
MKLWKDSFLLEGDKTAKWRYDQGVILKGMEGLWNVTGNGAWFRYIQNSLDFYIQEDGSIKGYKPDEYNIDHLNNGKMVLVLYEVTGKEKYKKAADLLRNQLRTHPRTSEGGFWHKKIYTGQMWLDGLYMGAPFYAAYARLFHEDSAFPDITRQFVLMEQKARDPKTGLLYHGWDETRTQQWADPKTGRSPNVWGRAMGWYGMALVDALDYYPTLNPGRDSLIRILNRLAEAVLKVQDPSSGVWYDILDKPKEKGNYREASASSMFVYTLAKAVRKGYLSPRYLAAARKGYAGLLKQFIKTNNGQTDLYGTVSVSGLGGKPYRDGSFAYYVGEPVVVNDPKGMGAFINAAVEMERLRTRDAGKGSLVLLDRYYNNEWKKDATGMPVRFHYTWEDRANSGFAMLGDLFDRFGFVTDHLDTAPDDNALKNANVYIIVDPDTDKETEKPNMIQAGEASAVARWVQRGGTLVLMGNDAGNANLESLNVLASRFGIHFNEDRYNLVEGTHWEQGAVPVKKPNPVFTTAEKLYVKELSTLQLSSPALAVLTKETKTIIAIAPYGKGAVFAIGDPWIYNEYLDGRRLPLDFDNYKGAEDLVRWIAQQVKRK